MASNEASTAAGNSSARSARALRTIHRRHPSPVRPSDGRPLAAPAASARFRQHFAAGGDVVRVALVFSQAPVERCLMSNAQRKSHRITREALPDQLQGAHPLLNRNLQGFSNISMTHEADPATFSLGSLTRGIPLTNEELHGLRAEGPVRHAKVRICVYAGQCQSIGCRDEVSRLWKTAGTGMISADRRRAFSRRRYKCSRPPLSLTWHIFTHSPRT